MLLIGFGHRARQGKSTAVTAMLNAPFLSLEVNIRAYAFADALKREVRRACATFGGQFALIEAWKDSGLMPEWVHFE